MESTSSTAMGGGQEHHRRSAHMEKVRRCLPCVSRKTALKGYGSPGWDAGVIVRSTNQQNLPWWGASFGHFVSFPAFGNLLNLLKLVLIPD
jgi:hypothetical protein